MKLCYSWKGFHFWLKKLNLPYKDPCRINLLQASFAWRYWLADELHENILLQVAKKQQNHSKKKMCEGTFRWHRIENLASPENFAGIWLCTSGMKLVKRFSFLSQRETHRQIFLSDYSAAREFGLRVLAGWRTRREHPLAGGKRP